MAVTWEVDVVEIGTETLVAHVPTAAVTRHTRRLNDIDDAEVGVSLYDDGFLAVGLDQDIVLAYEARVKRNGVTVLVGPWLTLDGDFDDDVANFQVVSWAWHFFQRFMGDAQRQDYITNGGFETGSFTGWSEFGTVTKSIEGADVNEGDKAAKLVASANNQGGIQQTLTGVTHGYIPGLGFFFAAYCEVTAGAVVDDDTVLLRVSATDGTNVVSEDVTWSSLVGTDHYQRVDTYLVLGGGVTWTSTIQLFSVNGTIRWDSVHAFFQDSTTVGYPGDDQATLFRVLVEHAQDGAYSKSDLGVGVDAPPTGVKLLLGYEHYLHENIGDAIVALTERRDGFDFSADHAARNMKLHYPRRGSVKDRWRVGVDRNVAKGGSLRVDGAQVRNYQVAMGDPAWSEEAGAVDAAELGGLTVEEVFRAPVGYPLRQLGQLVNEHVRQGKRRVYDVQLPVNDNAGDFAGNVDPGDTLAWSIQRGWVNLDLDARIVEIEEKPRAGDDGDDLVRCAIAPVDSSGS